MNFETNRAIQERDRKNSKGNRKLGYGVVMTAGKNNSIKSTKQKSVYTRNN